MLFQQLNDLNCLVFDEYETRLESLRANAELKNEFENLRQAYEPLKTRLIETFSKQKFEVNEMNSYKKNNVIYKLWKKLNII